VNWLKIHAEYVAGGISQRKLAQKHKIPWSTLEKRARREKWADDRERARTIIATNAVQETAEAVSENAAIAARIKTKLLKKLEKEIDALPDSIGSETKNSITEQTGDKNGKRAKEIMKAYKLRDLTLAYKDLTDDMNLDADTEPVRIIIDV
jgi:hypothetical protein